MQRTNKKRSEKTKVFFFFQAEKRLQLERSSLPRIQNVGNHPGDDRDRKTGGTLVPRGTRRDTNTTLGGYRKFLFTKKEYLIQRLGRQPEEEGGRRTRGLRRARKREDVAPESSEERLGLVGCWLLQRESELLPLGSRVKAPPISSK